MEIAFPKPIISEAANSILGLALIAVWKRGSFVPHIKPMSIESVSLVHA